MNHGGSLGIIGLAAVVAGITMLFAFFYTGDSEEPRTSGIVAGQARTASEGYSALDDWRASLSALGLSPRVDESATSTTPYTAPRGLQTSEALARELFVAYAAMREDGRVDAFEAEEAISALAAKRIGTLPPARTYTASSLTIGTSVTIAQYERSVLSALEESYSIREYELNTFARAMSENRASELLRLGNSARIYETIRDRLLRMPIPESVVREHLAVVNSMSRLAHATKLLSEWGGDSVDALILVGQFADAEESLRTSVENLYNFTGILKRRI